MISNARLRSLLGIATAGVAAALVAVTTCGGLVLAAIGEEDGTGGTQPMTSCADDGICNAAICGISGDPDCTPENCNADGRCVPECDRDPDCPKPPKPHPAHDERVIVKNPARIPYKAIAKVDIGVGGNARGTATLVAPCALLTNGHVVYDRKKQKFRAIKDVHPGSYWDDDKGKAVDPYGSRAAVLKATNTSWENTGDAQYDYGVIFIDEPFEHISATLIPLAFETAPTFINMAGYPVDGLPSKKTGAKEEQWRGWGKVEVTEDRILRYGAWSTGGASGSPVWTYDPATDARHMVAINQDHEDEAPFGIGVRLVAQNEGVITGWISDSCSMARQFGSRRRAAAPTAPAARVTFPRLVRERRTLSGDPIPMRTPDELGVVAAPAAPPPPSARTRTVLQWIEGELYKWEEYPAGDAEKAAVPEAADAGQVGVKVTAKPAPRYVRLVKPEARWLGADEASVLLSASMLWQRPPAKPPEPVYYQPPAKVTAVKVEAAPRRGAAVTPETELRSPPEE